MLEFIYSIIGAVLLGSGALFILAMVIEKIIIACRIKIIRFGLDTAYNQGYKDATEGKPNCAKNNPDYFNKSTGHVTLKHSR